MVWWRFSQELHDAIARANNAKPPILFVAAAGNFGQDNDLQHVYPACYQLPNIIAVAAIDSDERLASFSDYGESSVHIAAPGSLILSTVPTTKMLLWDPSGYGQLSGTSMATPTSPAALRW